MGRASFARSTGCIVFRRDGIAERLHLPLDGAFVATLLILREFMHHLGYPSVTVVMGAQDPGAREAAAGG